MRCHIKAKSWIIRYNDYGLTTAIQSLLVWQSQRRFPGQKKKNVSCTCQKKSEKRDASGISFMERQAYQAKVSLCSKMVMNLDDKLILKLSFKEVKGIY